MIWRSFMALLTLLSISACSVSPTVKTDHDPSINFSRFNTFFVAPLSIEDSPVVATLNPLMLQRLNSAISMNLNDKGLADAEPNDAQLKVEYLITVENRTDVHDSGFIRWGRFVSDIHVRHYKKGTLIVNIFDQASGEAIWHGTASQVFTDKTATEQQIQTTVSKVFGNFPPQ